MSDREEWLDERLAAEGLRRTGPVTCPHDRPWGTVHTAPTDRGPVWLKAPGEDWGDAVVAHPFSSMLVALAMVRILLGVGPDDPAVTRPRDAYLEVWSDHAPHAELVAELELACRVAKVARALTWARALRAQGHDQAQEFATAPQENLAALTAPSWSDLRPGS